MEALGEPQHRTKVKPCAGRSNWVSEPRVVTPDFQSCWDGIGAGGGGTSCTLTLGDLSGSEAVGREKATTTARRPGRSRITPY